MKNIWKNICKNTSSTLFLFCLLALPLCANPQVASAFEYQACSDLTKTNPQQALQQAIAAEITSDTLAATHCRALAHFALGQSLEAGNLFSQLASDIASDIAAENAKTAADLWAQAATAYAQAGLFSKAIDAQHQATEQDIGDARLWEELALLHAQQQDYAQALEALETAHAFVGDTPDILVLKANFLRHLNRLDEARVLLSQVLSISPEHAEGLLELGILSYEQGQQEGAQQIWRYLIRKAPKSEAAQTALSLLKRTSP